MKEIWGLLMCMQGMWMIGTSKKIGQGLLIPNSWEKGQNEEEHNVEQYLSTQLG